MKRYIDDIINYLKSNAPVREGLLIAVIGILFFIIILEIEIVFHLEDLFEKKLFISFEELFILLLIFAIALLIFSLRRYKDLKNEILERKKAVRKMQQSRAQLQAVLDGVPDIILQVDTSMRILWANKAALLKNSECIGQLCRVAFSDIEGLSIETYCKWAIETKRIEKGIRFQPSRSGIGGDKYWEGIGVPLLLSDGRVFGVIAIARNVTDHMQVEATRKILASIVESSDDAIFSESLDGIITSWNTGATKIFGYSIKDVLGKSSDEIIFKNIKSKINEFRDKLKKGKSIENYHIEYITNDSEKKFLSVTMSSVIHLKNHVIGFSTIARDITAQKKAEEALIASEAKYRNLFEYSLEGVGIIQRDKFISANKALLSIFGFSNLEDFVGRSVFRFVDTDSKLLLEYRMENRGTNKQQDSRYEIVIRRRDGEMRNIEISEGTITIGGEECIQSTFRDVTERKKADDELKRSREQLRNLATHLEKVRETERKEIAYEIHDDLGQSLTAMKMDILWIAQKLPKSEKKLFERAMGMSSLIDETINKIRMISTQLRPSILDHFGIGAAIEWLAEDFQKRTDISYKIKIEPRDIELDEFTSMGIFRICQEALTNITRHAEATTVDISLIQSNGELELIIKDDGIGISEEQVNDVHSFGLIGIRERAYLAGGTSSIVGVPGEGTIVNVKMPVNIHGVEKDD